MSGNYLAGAVWPPVIQHFVETAGWRQTYIGIGVFCLLTMLPLALVLPAPSAGAAPMPAARPRRRAARRRRCSPSARWA